MALPFSLADRTRKLPDAVPLSGEASLGGASHDPRALRILAKTIYRELRQSGLQEEDLMSVAGELLSLVAGEVKDRRRTANGADAPARGCPWPLRGPMRRLASVDVHLYASLGRPSLGPLATAMERSSRTIHERADRRAGRRSSPVSLTERLA